MNSKAKVVGKIIIICAAGYGVWELGSKLFEPKLVPYGETELYRENEKLLAQTNIEIESYMRQLEELKELSEPRKPDPMMRVCFVKFQAKENWQETMSQCASYEQLYIGSNQRIKENR
jgi:hypothetical protein